MNLYTEITEPVWSDTHDSDVFKLKLQGFGDRTTRWATIVVKKLREHNRYFFCEDCGRWLLEYDENAVLNYLGQVIVGLNFDYCE
jgi:hypothetical protein